MIDAIRSDISPVIDGFFVAFLISTVLLGITLVQTWTYVHNNQDKWPLRIFIAALVLLDIAVICCNAQIMHHYLIAHFGDFDVLRASTRTVSIQFMISGIIFFMCHLFFSYRLLRLAKSWWLPVIVTLSSIAMLILAAFITPVHKPSRQHVMMITSFHIIGVIADILVTIGFSRVLSNTGTKSGSTLMVLHQLLLYIITRGILISLVQIGHVIMYLINPKNWLFWVTLHLILPDLYVITTLVMLNSRERLRDKLQGFHINDNDIQLAFAHARSPSHSSNIIESSSEQTSADGQQEDTTTTHV